MRPGGAIDLHCHLLPGLDDGPGDLDGTLALAQAAVAAGTGTIVATPHIRDDYPFPLEVLPERVAAVREALASAGVALDVVPAGELSLARAIDMSVDALRDVAIGDGPYVLVESPYTQVAEFIESALFELQVRGFRPVLAHPERSPSFQGDLGRVAALVDRGVFVSITAASMAGRFGRTVKGVAVEMLAADLVHNVASDAHDTRSRPPAMLTAFADLEDELPGIGAQARWYTRDVPAAMLAGDDDLPSRPPTLAPRRRRGWRR